MKRILPLLLFPLLLGMVACGDDDSNAPPTTGTLSIHMTDAPADYDAVRITFAEISAHINGEWVVVNGNPVTVNLLEWNNGKSIEIGRNELGPGKYTQIRLLVTKAEVVVDGVTRNVTIPGAEQTGLKLNANFDIVAGSTYELILDFDAHQSIVTTGPPGNPTGYKLRPVIRVTERALTGSVSGKVSPITDPAVAMAFQTGVEITSTPVDLNTGVFKLAFLPPGTYDIAIEDINGKAWSTYDVTVVADADTTLGIVQLQ